MVTEVFMVEITDMNKTNHKIKHGMCGTKFYRTFYGMKNRCNNPNVSSYKYYGERGIKFLWDSYEDFVLDMYESYKIHVKEFGEKNTTIERINNDGNYCRENCKWATVKEQNLNTSQNRRLILNGEEKTISEWSEALGISRMLICGRIDRLGWSIEKTLKTPVGKLGTNQFSNAY